MRALVTTSGDSSRLPGPPPKSFRLIGGQPVVGRIINALEACDFIDQIDVIVRFDQMEWAMRAIDGSYECDLIPQGILGLTERIRQARKGDEALVVCLGDTLVQHHADELKRLVANQMPRARVLCDEQQIDYLGQNTNGDLRRHMLPGALLDVGSYYIPEGYPLDDGRGDESLLASLLMHYQVDAVKLSKRVHWRDVGTPEGFAAAELFLANGRL